ncbi:MAG TPA: TonB-dependent receptor [Longimicrobiales bacterium]|nr:TonB-dependent receptor [Longimicrobiales bacterium]
MARLIRPVFGVLFLLSAGVAGAAAQGVTTSSITGQVTSDGAPVPNAQIVVTNTSTGAERQILTRDDGRYLVTGLRPGGPYRVVASSLGYADASVERLNLGLGQTRQVDLQLAEQAIELEALTIAADAAGDNTGMQTVVDETTIQRAPTLNREIVDIARLTPQAFVSNEDDDGAAISIAGQNNEYNSLYIDGVVNNDVFGLSAQGTNGGQTGAPPISFDAIEQLQIAISPFDVTQSGFTGGAINVITRSGTNDFEGSIYYQLRNEGLAGESAWLDDPQPLPEFSTQRFGARLGGPIVQNAAFFFLSAELFRSESPAPFTPSVYGGQSLSRLDEIRQVVRDELGYDPGEFGDKASSLDDNKVLVKVDWDINEAHRLVVRHSYSQSDNLDAFASDADDINYANNSEVFPNTTNSTALELNSMLGERFANKLLLGMTFVSDDRGFAGDPFPYVTIDDSGGDINLGSERFSTGNILEQDIFTLTNNLNVFLGDHTLTIGTHNEFYDIGNLFLRENFGYYQYDSVDDFLQSVRAVNDPGIDPAEPEAFNRGFSLVDDVTGDASAAIGAFNAYQLGLYVQDDWRATDRLRLTLGLRMDVPKITTQPRTNDQIVDDIFPQLAAVHDLEGARPGETPDAAIYLAPRLGFTYDLTGDGATQIRGGGGVFTGRVPFVFPGAMFLNNGVTAGYVQEGGTLPNGDPIPFVPDVSNALDAGDFGQDVVPSGEVDVFAEDFRYPRVFRTSLGVDQRLPWGILATVEGQYTGNIDNITVENINFLPQNDNLDGPDNRPVYNYGTFGPTGLNPFVNRIQNEVNPVLKVSTTGEGYTYDVTAMLAKRFGTATDLRLSYTYGDAFSVNDATSDQIFSVWRFNENVNGLNNLEEARSDFSIGHRVVGLVTHRLEFLEHLGTTISAVLTGESGRPFSYIIGNNFTFTGEGSGTSPLAYIPEQASDLMWREFTDSDGNVVTVAEQMEAFDNFIDSDEYLSSRRGQYAERNGSRLPMEWVMDLRLAQEVFADIGGRRNGVELTLDIFNFTNLLNSDWGRRYNAGFRTVDLLRFERFQDATAGDLTPIYSFRLSDNQSIDEFWEERVLDFGSYGSRWLMQFGARYIF